MDRGQLNLMGPLLTTDLVSAGITEFHLERFLSAYISELNKGFFHVEIFRQTGLFKNCYFAKLGLLALIDQNTQGEIFDSEMDPSDQGGEVSIWL